jgi:hypothetical protein
MPLAGSLAGDAQCSGDCRPSEAATFEAVDLGVDLALDHPPLVDEPA